MSLEKNYQGYQSFSYLVADKDYPHFPLSKEHNRVPAYLIPLSEEQEERARQIVKDNIMISMHEHLGVFPDEISQTPAYVKKGRMATGFEGLSHAHWDAVFDNLMDGICQIHSASGWKWDDVLHDLGMRLCDIGHQDFVIHCKRVADIERAHREGKLAWVATMEGAAMIENEVDRLDILYGFGLRSIGITYSESNALGSGLKEKRDGGLTAFGHKAVERMNKLGLLIDCSHTSDYTALDTIAASKHPVVLSHIGARALWNTPRMAPDDVMKACAEKGGIIGVEAAPHTTLTSSHPTHNIEAFMEHFTYIKNLVGIDHVSFGPDTLYGDHVGLHHTYMSALSLKESKSKGQHGNPDYQEVPYVEGLENPTECSYNIVRWLVKEGYSSENIAKVIGGNMLRVLNQVWY